MSSDSDFHSQQKHNTMGNRESAVDSPWEEDYRTSRRLERDDSFDSTSRPDEGEGEGGDGIESIIHDLDSICSDVSLRKRVAFSDLEIREFPMQLGDNPSVLNGPPVTIGWEPQNMTSVDVEIFEYFREPRLTGCQLRMSKLEREDYLMSIGHSPNEIAEAIIETRRIQLSRAESSIRDPDADENKTAEEDDHRRSLSRILDDALRIAE